MELCGLDMLLPIWDCFGMNLEKFNTKWDYRFLDLAELVSSWSKDPSTKVGAVITHGNRVVSLGYNGFPSQISDDERLNNREEKYKIIIHAERNAMLFAQRDLAGCTIYTYPFMPCASCASIIIQSGIRRIVSYKDMPDRWKENFELSRSIFLESNVEVDLYDNK
jgi:dCMP deaminase